jgi:hypothetical protein
MSAALAPSGSSPRATDEAVHRPGEVTAVADRQEHARTVASERMIALAPMRGRPRVPFGCGIARSRSPADAVAPHGSIGLGVLERL